MEPPPYDHARDAATGLLNPAGIAAYTLALAGAVGAVLDFDLVAVRAAGAEAAARAALGRLTRPGLAEFWVHLDADVVDDAVMPAVDYRMPGGLAWDELAVVLRAALASGRAAGLEVTVCNPRLDADGRAVRGLADCLAGALA